MHAIIHKSHASSDAPPLYSYITIFRIFYRVVRGLIVFQGKWLFIWAIDVNLENSVYLHSLLKYLTTFLLFHRFYFAKFDRIRALCLKSISLYSYRKSLALLFANMLLWQAPSFSLIDWTFWWHLLSKELWFFFVEKRPARSKSTIFLMIWIGIEWSYWELGWW